MPNRTRVALVVILAGCATVPPEREERDRAILAAIKPCQDRYPDLFGRGGVGVNQDGRVRYWYKDHLVSQTTELEGCISEALKGVKIGPFAPGRLAADARPASIPVGVSGNTVAIPVRVNGVAGLMLLNAGSGLTSVKAGYARRAGLEIAAASPSVHVRFGSESLVVPFVRARALEIGGVSVEALDIAVHDTDKLTEKVDGVLGANVLSHFKWNVDRAGKLLTLEPLRASAPVAPPVAPAPSSREWRVPVWTIGDEWQLRWESPTGQGTYIQTVEREETVDGVVHYVLRSGARRTYYTKDTLAWHFQKNDDELVTLRRTPALTFAWPLGAGKSWQQKYERREGRNTEHINLTCTAIEEAKMTVPAGTFNTLRIRCNTPARVAWEWWYADEVKHWVRRRSVQKAGDRIDELVSYSPASAKHTRLSARLRPTW